MEVHSLVELVEMKNKTEIIVNKTTLDQDLNYPNQPYLIRVEGLFKTKRIKNFFPAHFTVTLYVVDGQGEWSLHSNEEDTFNFFELSPSHTPSERAQLLCHCLKKKETLDQIKKKFGIDSAIHRWVEANCPIVYRDTTKN